MSRVFVVDDDQDIRDLITFVLRRAGYDVVDFEDPRDALALAESTGFDLAVLDWSMPRMDGGELCARLRQLPPLADVPILVLTAHADSATRARAFEVGATRFMSKPFVLDELTDVVAKMLAAV
jgi:CheY-like chemotaxis protein